MNVGRAFATSANGIKLVLVFCTVRHTLAALMPVAAAVAGGLFATAGLHLWRGNAAVCVLGGTAIVVIIFRLGG